MRELSTTCSSSQGWKQEQDRSPTEPERGRRTGSLMNLKVQIEENKVDIFIQPLPMVMADEQQMVQLMQNLLGKSIRVRWSGKANGQDKGCLTVKRSGPSR